MFFVQDVEVRWNSTYTMLVSFIENRDAIDLLSLESEEYPAISFTEWAIMESVVFVLKPIYLATMDLQNRATTIACVIPMFRTVLFKLGQKQDNKLSLNAFRGMVAAGLRQRMIGWEDNKYFFFVIL